MPEPAVVQTALGRDRSGTLEQNSKIRKGQLSLPDM